MRRCTRFVGDELRTRGITRSSNNPTGDLAEDLFCKAFGWKQVGNSQLNIGAIGAGAFVMTSNTILLGRTTHEMFAPAWRDRTVDDDPGAPFFNETEKHVVSSTLTTADWSNSSVMGPYDPEAIRKLKASVEGSVYVSGSATLVRAMLTDPHSVPALGDGGAHYGMICDSTYTTFLLTHWGRDRKAERIDLPTLVNAMTARPAAIPARRLHLDCSVEFRFAIGGDNRLPVMPGLARGPD